VSLVSARDREVAAVALRRHFVSGRLSTDELGDRVRAVFQARSRADLRQALEGLPPAWRDGDELRRLGLVVRRGAILAVLATLWLIFSFLLLLVFAVTAIAHGVSTGGSLGFFVVWLAVTILAWRVGRRA
jgi:hypothetical protein